METPNWITLYEQSRKSIRSIAYGTRARFYAHARCIRIMEHLELSDWTTIYAARRAEVTARLGGR